MRTPRLRAFTLVELLVVIGIIAVLISILLPSLNRARQNAQLVACASQLRQVGVATRAYAVENRDALPPVNLDLGSKFYHGYRNAGDMKPESSPPTTTPAQQSAWVRTVQWPFWRDSQTSSTPEAIGSSLGRLNITGFLKGDFEKVTSCPQRGGGEINGAYYTYNIHQAYRTPTGPTGAWFVQPWWKKVSQYGRVKGDYQLVNLQSFAVSSGSFGNKRFALGSDPILTPSQGPQIGSATHLTRNGRAYNLLFIDGSVEPAVIPNTVQRPNGVNDMSRFRDFVGYLEGVVSGTPEANARTVFGVGSNPWYVMPLNP